jgi:hypothetical protein
MLYIQQNSNCFSKQINPKIKNFCLVWHFKLRLQTYTKVKLRKQYFLLIHITLSVYCSKNKTIP